MKLEVYLYFKGNCKEAMEFYKGVFGGDLNLTTYGETRGTDPEHKDWIMHASLQGGDISLMASDTSGASDKVAKIELCLVGADEAKIRKAFEALSQDGKVSMPLDKQAWGDIYGKLTDQFNIEWAFNIGSAGA